MQLIDYDEESRIARILCSKEEVLEVKDTLVFCFEGYSYLAAGLQGVDDDIVVLAKRMNQVKE